MTTQSFLQLEESIFALYMHILYHCVKDQRKLESRTTPVPVSESIALSVYMTQCLFDFQEQVDSSN